MMLVVFWGAYVVLMLSAVIWLAKHPLSVGGCVLLSYMSMSILVGLVVSFVAGVFLFLTGVSGMMVAFLYVVALCPNPVFVGEGSSAKEGLMSWLLILAVAPVVLGIFSFWNGFSAEASMPFESLQWMRDPSMLGGLAELIPVLGILLFLCMVSVVSLCGQQKQCLGGQGGFFGGLSGSSHTKRSYV